MVLWGLAAKVKLRQSIGSEAFFLQEAYRLRAVALPPVQSMPPKMKGAVKPPSGTLDSPKSAPKESPKSAPKESPKSEKKKTKSKKDLKKQGTTADEGERTGDGPGDTAQDAQVAQLALEAQGDHMAAEAAEDAAAEAARLAAIEADKLAEIKRAEAASRAKREAEIRAEKARLQGIEDGKNFAQAQIIAGMKIQACLRGALVRKRNRRQKRLRQLRDPDGFDWCCVNKQGKNALKVMLAERERMVGYPRAQHKQHLKMMLNDPVFLETKVTKYLEERYAAEEPPEIAELRLAAQKAEEVFQEMQRVAAFKAEQARLQKEMKAAMPIRKRADLTFSSGSAASLEEARANLAHVPMQKLSTVPRLNLDKSATIIQSRSRGNLARQQTSMLMLEKRGPPSTRAPKVPPPVPRLNLDKSATIIQSRSRGKLARQQTSMLMLEKRGPPSVREKVPRIHLNFTVLGDHVSIDWVVAME